MASLKTNKEINIDLAIKDSNLIGVYLLLIRHLIARLIIKGRKKGAINIY